MNQGFNFFGGSFSNRDNVRESLEEKVNPSILKNDFSSGTDPIHFHIDSTSVIRPVKQNQLRFSGIEIYKPLPALVHSVSKIRFKFRSQF